MLPYKQKELEERGLIDTWLSGKPEQNAWVEINNILAATGKVTDLASDALKKGAAKWGVSFNERNVDKRREIYSQLVEAVYENVSDKQNIWFGQCEVLANSLELSPQMVQYVQRAAKNRAYAERCRAILAGKESMTVTQLNEFFGCDYEGSLAARREAFDGYFYSKFEKFEEIQRYSQEDEADLAAAAKKLDVPLEFKENISSALTRFRNLWNAESRNLQPIQVQFPLNVDEECYAGTNSGRCVNKKIQEEDNFFDHNHKFKVDDTLAFKGAELDTNKRLVEHLIVEEMGYFFLTNQRLLFLSEKNAVQHPLNEITGADYRDNCIFFHLTSGGDAVYKFSDEASECMFMMFNRVKAGRIKIN